MSLAEADFRLKEWGSWVANCITGGQGFASQSTIVSALSGGRSTAPFYPKDNERAEQIDSLVNDMKTEFPIWEQVVRAEYTNEGTQTYKVTKTNVRSLSHYRSILENAKVWVCAHISKKIGKQHD